MSFPDAHIILRYAYHHTYQVLHDMRAHIILKTENITGKLKTEMQ